MTRTRIKICGITRERDARAAIDAGVDALGFVCWAGSPRTVSPRVIASFGRRVPAFVMRVGVFVNATPRDVARVVRIAGLDAIQLHGDEDPVRFKSCGAAVIKAVTLTDADDVRRAERLPGWVTILVDARDLVLRGGTGRPSNWTLARRLATRRPIVLAGGLHAGNIARAIRTVRPWAVDVSSGVEDRPGRKNAAKINDLVRRIVRVDREG